MALLVLYEADVDGAECVMDVGDLDRRAKMPCCDK